MTEVISTTLAPTVATSAVVTLVFDQILQAVHEGALKPGQRINDNELAAAYGVSRTPVREALQRLREIGIIEASASRFTRVAEVSPEQMVDALKVWTPLYGAVLDETVPDADDAVVAELEEHHRAFAAAIPGRDVDELGTANFRFFDVLVKRSRNAILQRSITGVVHLLRLGAEHLPAYMDLDALAGAQQEIIEAARSRDVLRARAALGIAEAVEVD